MFVAETCRCIAQGDPHYFQFDGGKRIDFMGKCKYTFTKMKDQYKNSKCYFNIEEKNVHRGNTRVSFVKLVDVQVEDMRIRFNHQTGKLYVCINKSHLCFLLYVEISSRFMTTNINDSQIPSIPFTCFSWQISNTQFR